MIARVELHCRRYPTLAVDGRPVALKLKAGLALLVFLSEQSRPVARAQLAELLWPDAPVDTGRARLRRLAHQVNGVLGCELLAGDVDALWIDRASVGLASDAERTRRCANQLLAAPHDAPSRESIEELRSADAPLLLAGFDFESERFAEWLGTRRCEQERLVVRALGQGGQHLLNHGQPALAAELAGVLIGLDPLADAGHALLLTARGRLGDAAAVEAAYFACAELLRRELGIRPSAQIESAYAGARAQLAAAVDASAPATQVLAPIRFADSDEGTIAYLELGRRDAPWGTLLILFGLWSHVELSWEEPRIRGALERLAEHFHVVLMDRRGVGLSERLAADQDLAAGVHDIDAVLRALAVDRAWLFGSSAGGTVAIEYAALRPERMRGLLLYAAQARGTRADDHPWGLTEEQMQRWLERLHGGWGGATSLAEFAPSAVDDEYARAWWARNLRQATSRHSLRVMLRAFGRMDVRDRLPRLAVPTLVIQREGDRIVRAGAARYLAERIAGAELQMLPGDDNLMWLGDTGAVLGALEGFVERRVVAQ